MDLDERSGVLFGRYQALRVYWAVGLLTKPEFTTAQVATLSNVASSQCSKELARLARLGLVRQTSRRGDYERIDDTGFWTLVAQLVVEWSRE